MEVFHCTLQPSETCRLINLHLSIPVSTTLITAVCPHLSAANLSSAVQSVLSTASQESLCDALCHVSTTLFNRMRPHASSSSVSDVYEALTAAVYLMSSACHLNYVSRHARRESFERVGWNHSTLRHQSVDDMVEAGFFCLGDEDHVKCFFCDLGLRDWDAGDSPEMEHAKFSPLCFFLKSSRGLDWLRRSSPRPPNYPTSYSRQDHNQLLKVLWDEFCGSKVSAVRGLGFSDTKVLLCVARKFIRFRQSFSSNELVAEMQKEWDKEMKTGSSEDEQFIGKFDVAKTLTEFIAAGA